MSTMVFKVYSFIAALHLCNRKANTPKLNVFILWGVLLRIL